MPIMPKIPMRKLGNEKIRKLEKNRLNKLGVSKK